MQRVFRTRQPVIIYPRPQRRLGKPRSSTRCAGDKVLMAETGNSRCCGAASPRSAGSTSISCGDWRRGANIGEIERVLPPTAA